MSGFEVCRQLKQAERTAEIPIIFVSALQDVDDRLRGFEAGGVDYITKPFQAEEVLARVNTHLTLHRLRKQLEIHNQQLQQDLIREQSRLTERIQSGLRAGNFAWWELELPSGAVLFDDRKAEMLGYASERFNTDEDFSRLVHPDDQEKVRQALQDHLSGKAEKYEVEYRIKTSTGVYKWFRDVGAITERDAGTGDTRIIGIVEDITKRRQLEEQYYQAQKMEAVGRLTGGIAHDFNNLLTGINGFAEMLHVRMPTDDPDRSLVDRILHSGERAAGLIRQLMAFSRKQIVEPRVISLNTVVAELDKLLQRIIGEDIQMRTVLSPELWPVKIDPVQIEQVIVNLAVNARDAMPGGGRFTIETANIEIDADYVANHPGTQPGPYVLLAVSDTGHGMDAATQEHIFEPFFTTKEKGQGTGLGLATVFGIVQQSGGHIVCYNEPDLGTSFKIYLPRAREPLPASIRMATKRKLPGGQETILLVEDDVNVRGLVQQMLQQQGYTVLEAPGGLEALDLVETQAVDGLHVLLTDVVLPGMSGKELAETLMKARPGLKVIFMSGYTDQAIAHHGVLAPGTAFIQKPFRLTALVSKVREVLDTA